MKKEARVLIVEDDPFAENWMALLLSRDWRARVIGETKNLAGMEAVFATRAEDPNLVLINAELLDSRAAWETLRDLPGQPLVLLIAKRLDPAVVDEIPFAGFCGFLLKEEIHYALGWAIGLAGAQDWIITPGVEQHLHRPGAGGKVWVLDGRRSVYNLTAHEAEVARLALIFSMERREMSDEMKISPDWTYGQVSAIYRKLGMEEILSGEVDPAEYLGKAFTDNPRFQEIVRRAQKSRKKNDLETLAFHILCMPEIRELE